MKIKGKKLPGKIFKKLLSGFAAALLFSVLLAGCAGKDNETQAETQKVPVQVATVEKGELVQVTTLYGKLSAGATVALAPATAGKVGAVPVKVGDEVHAGQVIIQLDDADVRAQVAQFEAALAVARAGQREAAVAEEEARVNLKRKEELYAQDAISAQELEAAQNTYRRAASGRSAAAVRQAEANLNYWRNQLENMRITTPIKGLVASLEADPGEMLGPNAPVASVVNLETVIAECNVPEDLINKVHKGAVLNVRVPALNKNFEGRVAGVAPAADPQSKSFPVEVEIRNPGQLLKAGMFAEIELSAGKKEGVLRVPGEAVVEKGDRKVVYQVEDGVACEKKVTPGISNGAFTEIVSGLQEGASVVVAGQEMLKDGVAVEVGY